MKPVYLLITLSMLVFASCSKNSSSKIPHITLKYFGPVDASQPVVSMKDTAILIFSLVDGDADIGRSNTDDLYVKDLRFPTSAPQPNAFPEILPAIKDPAKGLEAECQFMFPNPLVPRSDSAHMYHDTVSFEVYVLDEAGNKSNSIITNPIVITP